MESEAARETIEVPVACNLAALTAEQRERQRALYGQLRADVKEVCELEDGYEFVFPGGARWAETLVSFVVSERVCCPFFAFEMIFGPEGGTISLRVRGPERASEFMREEFVGG
jgi:hypothetical protein